MWKHQNLRSLRTGTPKENYLRFNLQLNAADIRYTEV